MAIQKQKIKQKKRSSWPSRSPPARRSSPRRVAGPRPRPEATNRRSQVTASCIKGIKIATR